jgi:hypothetical protein
VEPQAPRVLHRWRYAKRVDPVTGDIWVLFRLRDSQVEVLEDGKWRSTAGDSAIDLDWDPGFAWLSPIESRNLLAYLRTGQTDLPVHLDREPKERYQKWKCPNCGTFTVVPVVVGMPSFEDGEAAREGHLILQGCIFYGDEPKQAVACTTCDWFGELIRDRTILQIPRTRAFRNQYDLNDELEEE